MTLTSEAVQSIVRNVLFKDDEDKADPVLVEGITRSFGFHRGRITESKPAIKALLEELPEPFRTDKGGGWSFLMACEDRHGNQWTSFHAIMEELFCLGIAAGYAKWLAPRELWSVLPGGVPYVGIDLNDAPQSQAV